METIFSQTLKDWELIVCDSYSDDGTWEYFQKFKGDPRIRLYQVPREGLYAGWNECLRRVTGEYVYIATADDTCKPRLLEKMIQALEQVRKLGTKQWPCHKKPDSGEEVRPVDMAICKCNFIDEAGGVISDPDAPFYSFSEWNDKMHIRGGDLELLAHLCLGVSWSSITSVLFRRSLLDSVGLFKADCGPGADIFWAVRSAIFTDAVWIPEALATWRCYPEQGSREKSLALSMRTYEGLSDMLTDLEDLLPVSWTDREGWRRDLLCGWRNVYLKAYGLDRGTFKKSPLQFLKGCVNAAVSEPAYLFKRLAHRFRWHNDAYVPNQEVFRLLLKQYEVSAPVPFSFTF